MCDTVCVVEPGRVLFGKNSDRDANEGQVLDWVPATDHRSGDEVRCTWMRIPQVAHTHAVLLSRPFWIWGAEMGANEHGVVIGNEAVFTRAPVAAHGMLGMDLLRLALERATTAAEATTVITTLLERHGQGGSAGLEDARFRYHNSFLIADAHGAVVLETCGRRWAIEEVTDGVRSISNELTIPGFSRQSDRLRSRVAGARRRRSCVETRAATAEGAHGLFGVLRDHGGPHPRYRWARGTLDAPCMHGGGSLFSSVTTGSWVSELTPTGARHWATGTAGPCTALFKPVAVDTPVDVGQPTDRADHSLWWRHERLHRRVLRDPARLRPEFVPERDAAESRWARERPSSAAAFAEGDALLEAWTASVASRPLRDVRPLWARRYWERRNRLASLDLRRA